jgi:hypothetical protein
MKPLLLTEKSVSLLAVFLLLASFDASAQKKSVYDVIPGSGPKKTQTSKSVIIFRDKKTNNKRNTYPVFTTRRKNLPPGQAKKIYGGSATDYAPGQVKKHHPVNGWKGEHGKKGHSGNHGRGH